MSRSILSSNGFTKADLQNIGEACKTEETCRFRVPPGVCTHPHAPPKIRTSSGMSARRDTDHRGGASS